MTKPLSFGSVCSGIEAASEAWRALGWRPAFFSEIEPFPCAVLAHRHPSVPNHGDMTKFNEWPNHAIDILVGGTPCQSFSVAGLRKGMDDPRGNLALTFLAMARRFRPRWIVWENVPGVHSSWTDAAVRAPTDASGGRDLVEDARRAASLLGPEFSALLGDGNLAEADQSSDFDCFLAGMVELGYGFATRVLDAQHFGVAQRRRRVFVVGHLGAWQPAAAVLFEPSCLRWDNPPGRGAGEGPAGTLAGRPSGGGGLGTDAELSGGLQPVAGTLDRGTPGRGGAAGYMDHLVPATAGTLTSGGDGRSAGSATLQDAVSDLLIPGVAGSVTAQGGGGRSGQDALSMCVPHTAPTLKAGIPGDSKDAEELLIPVRAHALTGDGGGHRNDPTTQTLVAQRPVAFNWQSGQGVQTSEDVAPCLIKNQTNAVAYGRPVDTTGFQGDVVVRDGDVAPALSAQGGNNGGGSGFLVETDKGTPAAPLGGADARATSDMRPCVCVDMGGGKAGNANVSEEVTPSLNASGAGHAVQEPGTVVRRLTPTECERLQGFPDDHTLIPGDWRVRDPEDRAETLAYLLGHGMTPEQAAALADCPDGPRYKACGNSMATPVMEYVGDRIALVHAILYPEGAP